MKKAMQTAFWLLRIFVGTGLFSVGFNMFLGPNNLNAGGLSGLAQLVVTVLDFGSVGLFVVLLNLPLFALAGIKVGKKFFLGSLAGMLSLTVTLEIFSFLPVPQVDTLLAALYGGVMAGIGVGIVFMAGASTGGSDIIVRLLKLKMQHINIGTITICFDCVVVLLTGIVFQDITRALYSGVVVFVTGKVVDAVVYSFDYSKAVMIMSKEYETVAKVITKDLNRGATYLKGEGTYSGREMKVVFTVVKKQQLPELKRLVNEVDPNAFVVVQEAHQVLGEGFARYSKDSL